MPYNPATAAQKRREAVIAELRMEGWQLIPPPDHAPNTDSTHKPDPYDSPMHGTCRICDMPTASQRFHGHHRYTP